MYFKVFLIFSSLFIVYFAQSQATLPAFADFSESNLPGEGWTSNSNQYYTTQGNPAPAFKFDATGKHLTVHYSQPAGVLSFELRANSIQSTESIFKVQESVDGENYTDVLIFEGNSGLSSYAVQTAQLDSDSRYVRFIYANKVNGNYGLDNVLIEPALSEEQHIAVKLGDDFIPQNHSQEIASLLGDFNTIPLEIHNLGTENQLIITDITISGTHAENFEIIENLSFPIVISANDKENFTLKFEPTDAGERHASISIESNDPENSTFLFHIVGTELDAPVLANQPTNLIFSTIKTYRFKANFTGSNADGYLVLRKDGQEITEIPTNGEEYSRGDIIGNAKVVQSGNWTTFSPNYIVANTTYNFAVFAYKNTEIGRIYTLDNPLTGLVQTPETMAWPNVYANISTSSPTFVEDLHNRVANHTQHSYATYTGKMIEKFYERDTVNGQKVLTCLYTGEIYSYAPPFGYNYVGFSREHTFAYSWFPIDNQGANYYSDYHNLFPIHHNLANGIRSNYPMGNVVSDTIFSSGNGILGRNTQGKIVYEPWDEHKGDVARAMFYMSVRYTEGNILWKIPEYISYSIPYGQDQQLLKEWNEFDPPSRLEMARNDYIDSLQGNRNPFIDHPEYACFIDFHKMEYLPTGCNPLGLTENISLLQNNLHIFPNPTKNTINLRVDNSLMLAYTLYDYLGKKIDSKPLNELEQTSIDSSQLSSGIYFIEVKTLHGNLRQKIVVK